MLINSIKTLFRIPLLVVLASVFVTACGEEELLPEPQKPAEEIPKAVASEANQYVNSWIQENMEYWYLWNTGIPEDVDENLAPEAYFDALLNEEDRFSWIQSNYNELLNALQGISREAGYEFVLYREKEGSENVVLQIVYTKPGSPAATAGLKRGDMISHINDQQLTVTNYQELLASIKDNHTVQYKPLIVEEEKFGDIRTLSLNAIEYSENPNYLHRVIETGGKKIGYFVYNFFASGTDDEAGKYDAEMDAIFGDFKSQGITDLIIDLRYNSGGSESSAKNLASLIGRGTDESKVFLKRQYNDFVQEAILNDENLGEDYLISHYKNKTNNVGNLLSSGRVYILTSSRTASASELIINALKPFMEVFLIGDKTYGKNVGSISLFEEKDPKNLWGMQPIVVKVYNSEDKSDYSTGFVPDVTYQDNGTFLYPLGDEREALLSQAIGQITGTATIARKDRQRREPIGHSLDLKRRSFSLIMDEGAVDIGVIK